MGGLKTILLVIAGISLIVFVIFFGRLPALRNTPIATLHKIICVYIPNGFIAIDQKFTSGAVASRASRFWNAMLYDRHPSILIFFLLLLSVGQVFYVPTVWPQISLLHKAYAAVLILCPYLLLYLSAAGDPGYISPDNVDHYLNLYPYDFSIFHPGQECRTCRILKPARSKHCSICKRCVARSDHHCVFINKCVGYGNHRWFVLLLLSTAVLTTHGALLGISLLSAKIRVRLPTWTVWPGSELSWERYFMIWSWSLQDCVGMGSVTLLTLLVSPMVWAFLFYTVYMLFCGMTTNESLKWSDWKDEIKYGTVYRRSMPASRSKDARFEGLMPRWPADTEQILVTTDSGQPPTNPNLPGYGTWEAVSRFTSLDNLYDQGFWCNILDVFVPNYPFRSKMGRLPDNSSSSNNSSSSSKRRRGNDGKRLTGKAW